MARSRCKANVWLTNRSAKWWKKYANHSRRVQERNELADLDEDTMLNKKRSSRVDNYTSPKDGAPGWGSDTLAEFHKTRGK